MRLQDPPSHHRPWLVCRGARVPLRARSPTQSELAGGAVALGFLSGLARRRSQSLRGYSKSLKNIQIFCAVAVVIV